MRIKDILTEATKKANSVIKTWKNNDASEYAKKLIKTYGEPDDVADTLLYWRNISVFYDVYIIDESVPHDFPKPHRDYVYASMVIPIPENLVKILTHVSGSIIIDGLKNQVTARCGSLFANAATLGFVQDLVDGKVNKLAGKAKKEYGRRILNGVLPEWYENKMKE